MELKELVQIDLQGAHGLPRALLLHSLILHAGHTVDRRGWGAADKVRPDFMHKCSELLCFWPMLLPL